MNYNRLLADFRWHGDNLSAPNIERRDMRNNMDAQSQASVPPAPAWMVT